MTKKNKVIYVANIEYDKFSGIYKKIESHALVLSRIFGECVILCKKKEQIVFIVFKNGLFDKLNELKIEFSIGKLNKLANQLVDDGESRLLYYRHTLRPSYRQLLLFRSAKKKDMKIIYEIPTYPFFKEQLSVAKRPYLTFFKLVLEIMFFPYLFKKSTIIPILLSNSKKKILKKMYPITNGVNPENYHERIVSFKEKKEINFIGVGTLYGYHGFDRLIRAISNENMLGNGKRYFFHIVGDGPEIEKLKKLVKSLNMQSLVLFHGRLSGENLDQVFDKSDIGVSALALYERSADIDTTLKLIDYLCRGFPSISSDEEGLSKTIDSIFTVSNDDIGINLNNIEAWYSELSKRKLQKNQKKFLVEFSWENILERILNKIGEI
ncbi:glycosyltransferase [Enterococcus sp. HY326]|uniref:glycosyltransferase n=1 Tax=Enterococcus sp. HY326 TaxID=2971265 RepID=UPI002240CEBF|nr:glycosyltransferase [Enterococcus sp. HY326]